MTRIESGRALERALRGPASALSFCPLSSMASPTIRGEVRRGRRAPQLHLAELGDHLEAADLAVHLARARERLEVVGMQLPGALIQTERAFALGDHVLDESRELEQTLGLLGLGARRLQLLLQLIDC